MDTRPPPPSASRRHVLVGLGAAVAAPIAFAGGAAAAQVPDGSARTKKPECLADLVEMGVVGRADFVAG